MLIIQLGNVKADSKTTVICISVYGYMLVITSKYKNEFLSSSIIFLYLHVNKALYRPYTVNIKNHNHLYGQVLWVYMCKELVLVYCKKNHKL